jgi:hypothetical protein
MQIKIVFSRLGMGCTSAIPAIQEMEIGRIAV